MAGYDYPNGCFSPVPFQLGEPPDAETFAAREELRWAYYPEQVEAEYFKEA